tara:strand:- start:2377 stop:3963 length:1587 start_codon:yes stop_codon:yes gene_type:complete
MGWKDAPAINKPSADSWQSAPAVDQGGDYYPPGDSRNGPADVTVGQPAPGFGANAVDAIRSVPGGLAKGFTGLAGLPGDLTELGGLAGNAARNLITGENRKYEGTPNLLPTTGMINEAVSEPFGGYYKPQTPYGEYAQTISSFAPNAIGGPGGIAARVARVAIPGAGSEAAGQSVRGTKLEKYEPLFRAGGALAGGFAAGNLTGAAGQKAPTLAELGNMKTATYKAAEQHGVIISAPSWQKFAQTVEQEMKKRPFRGDDLHQNANRALKTLAAEKGDVTLENADAIRQVLADAIEDAAKNTNKGDVGRATKIKDMLDEYLDNLSAADTLSGDAKLAVPILKDARGLAQREFKTKKIEEMIELAENSASTNYSASGLEQALRVQFRALNAKLIKNPNLAKGFTSEERAALKSVSEGGPIGNGLRWLGKYSPNGSVQTGMAANLGLTGGAGLGYLLSGGNPAVAAGAAFAGQAVVPTIGALARGGANIATNRNVRLAEELMRRGPAQANSATTIPQNVLLGTLLSQQGGR